MTPHIEARKKEIAKVVLMPGDPLRAKYIAQNFLKNVKCVNKIRGMFAYTGIYKNKKITVMGHGMGGPSIGIYTYELYKFYNVKHIIRIGSSGGYKTKIKVGDIIVSKSCYSESRFGKDLGIKKCLKTLYPSDYLLSKTIDIAKQMKLPIHLSHTFCEDVYYNKYTLEENLKRSNNADVVEQEAFALYATAHFLKKHALVILTSSICYVTNKCTTNVVESNSLKKMIKLALNIGISLK